MAKLRRKYTETQIAKAYAALASSPGGEIVLWDLCDRYIDTSSLVPDGNVSKIVANEGKRFVVLEILSRVEQGELEYGRRIVDADPIQRDGHVTERDFDIYESGMGKPDRSGEPGN